MKSIRFSGFVFSASLLAAACSHEVRPDDMSAQAHHAAARKESQAAKREMAKARFESPGQDPLGAGIIPELYYNPDATSNLVYDPALRAQSLERRAREHEQAAAELESGEAAACKDIPAAQRNMCPSLDTVAEMRAMEGGVRLRLADRAQVDTLLAQLRCSYAYAREHGFGERRDCVFALPGVEFRATPDPRAIDIVSRNRKAAAELRKLVHEGFLGGVAANGS